MYLQKLGTGKATDTDLYIDDEGDDDIQLQDASGSGPRRHGKSFQTSNNHS